MKHFRPEYFTRTIAGGYVCHASFGGVTVTAACRFAICALLKAKRKLRKEIRSVTR